MTDDEREAYEERAAIAEHHGGLSRAEAEALARRQVERMREDSFGKYNKGLAQGKGVSYKGSNGGQRSAPRETR